MRILLVGDQSTYRAEVREVLGQLTEPELAIGEVDFDSGAQAKPAEVVMVLFNDDEDRPLNFLQRQSELRRARRPCSRCCPNARPA